MIYTLFGNPFISTQIRLYDDTGPLIVKLYSKYIRSMSYDSWTIPWIFQWH